MAKRPLGAAAAVVDLTDEAETKGAGLPKRRRQGAPEADERAGGAKAETADVKAAGADVDGKPWTRPPVPLLVPATMSMAIQQIETDYTVGMAHPRYCTKVETGKGQQAAQIRLFGVSEHGNSVLMHIHGFMPYFYVPCWEGVVPPDVRKLGDALNLALEASRRKGKDERRDEGRDERRRQCEGYGDREETKSEAKRHVVAISVVERRSIWGLQTSMKRFFRIVVAIPALVATSRRLFEEGKVDLTAVPAVSALPQRNRLETFESNVPFALRFMMDHSIVGGGWVEAAMGKWSIRPSSLKVSHCQVELDVFHNDVIGHPADSGKWIRVAPLRILSFDIECQGRKGCFPDPTLDPVIQIGSVVMVQGEKTPRYQSIHTLNTCSPVASADVIENETETDLLRRWRDFVEECDPDIITGWNIIDFDLLYLMRRASTLGLTQFAELGRMKRVKSQIKAANFSSKGLGKRESMAVTILGRVQFDMIVVVRREHKLRSYTLNAVCAHFLKQQKEDVHHSIISDLQNGTAETRRRLAVYCLKDALLPIRLMEKLMALVNSIEMARVTGVTLTYLLTRGQQIKVLSQMYPKCAKLNYLIPTLTRRGHGAGGPADGGVAYEGATVIEPERGFYDCPIATLDFASLYPSIMMAHNLCYTTYLTPQQAAEMDPSMWTRTPSGDHFVKASVKQGILPMILTELIAARKKTRAAMVDEKDPAILAVLNGRQLAIKISANSVYGFTGATVGQLPMLQISASVTAFGRQMIERTKSEVETKYTIANGYTHNAHVIYGDTDSVMVKFGTFSVAESMKLGAEAAVHVSTLFVSPIKLEFEKVYFPFLLMNKKRYSGLYWTNPRKWDKLDSKGIETVRRDNCPLVSSLVGDSLHQILIERNPTAAIDLVKQCISDLLTNRVDLSQLVISKSLGKSADAKDYTAKQAHVELAARMKKRDAQSAPSVGDRVAYVIVKGCKGAKAYEKAEDPMWVLDHGLSIDTHYYLTNQLEKPLLRIFEPILGDKVSSLFTGEHTRHIKLTTPSADAGGGLMRFAVKKPTCAGCKAVLGKTDRGGVCSSAACQGRVAEIYLGRMETLRSREMLFSKLWTQCQRCQGSLHQEVLCSNRDCPIFYRRKKCQKEVQEAQTLLDNLSF